MPTPTLRQFSRVPLFCVIGLIATVAAILPRLAQAQTAAPAAAPAADTSANGAPAGAAASAPRGRRGGGRGRGPQGPRTGLHLIDIGLHDPWILAEASTKTYYMYVPGRGGMAYYKSKDLLTWDGPYPCFTIPSDSWANPSEGLWAPEVHFWKGKY